METRNGLIRAKSDRLSSLPDEILCNILSFLPTKFSVATSILATRYRYLWRDVVNLHFDDYEYHYGKDDVWGEYREDDRRYSFSAAVNTVMLLRSNLRDINSFRLVIHEQEYSSEEQEYQLDTWIRYAIARNVQSLNIQLRDQPDHDFPSCLFTSQTLVHLSLDDCGCVPDNIFLPNLKKLYLYVYRRERLEKIGDIISGCPVLEELDIELTSELYFDIDFGIISSPTLKWLTLDFDVFDRFSDIPDHKLEINTPALRYLDITDDMSQVRYISTGVFNSLVEASISLTNDEVVHNNIYSDSVLEFVERLCQVKRLIFFTGRTQFLDSSFALVTSKFINLTKLELGADLAFLLKFLEIADNLQVLIIRELHCRLECWTEPQQVPTCLSSNLRQVRVDTFGRGLLNELEMVSYILKHGKVLNEMKIYVGHLRTNKEKLNARQRISEFERGSQTCELKFS